MRKGKKAKRKGGKWESKQRGLLRVSEDAAENLKSDHVAYSLLMKVILSRKPSYSDLLAASLSKTTAEAKGGSWWLRKEVTIRQGTSPGDPRSWCVENTEVTLELGTKAPEETCR